MARTKKINFDKEIAEIESEDEEFSLPDPFVITYLGRDWTINPKKVPVGKTMKLLEVQQETAAHDFVSYVAFWNVIVDFICFLLSEEQAIEFVDLLSGVGVPEDGDVPEFSHVVNLAFRLMEEIAERPS